MNLSCLMISMRKSDHIVSLSLLTNWRRQSTVGKIGVSSICKFHANNVARMFFNYNNHSFLDPFLPIVRRPCHSIQYTLGYNQVQKWSHTYTTVWAKSQLSIYSPQYMTENWRPSWDFAQTVVTDIEVAINF